MSSQGKLSCEDLDSDHRDCLYRAVCNVLDTGIALTTYAQIIDGLPISSVASDQYNNRYGPGHPIKAHVAICPGALEEAEKFRASFEPESLRFSSTLLQAYQSAKPSSGGFALRLVELTAAALHQIAIFLFNIKLQMHDAATTQGKDIDSVTIWEREPDEWARSIPYPTMFTHPSFQAVEQYPNGLADIVGYWAENRILGGVSLFDRSQDWDGTTPEPNLYFQPSRYNVTYRICQLLDEQQHTLVDFLLADRDVARACCPLPILPGEQNRVRIDPEDAIPMHKVYRDIWERKQVEKTRLWGRNYYPCVSSSLDYPELDVDEEIERLDRIWEESERRRNRQGE